MSDDSLGNSSNIDVVLWAILSNSGALLGNFGLFRLDFDAGLERFSRAGSLLLGVGSESYLILSLIKLK